MFSFLFGNTYNECGLFYLGTKGTSFYFSNSWRLFFPLICLRRMKTQKKLGNNLEWPTLTINYLLILIFCKTFFFANYSYECQINLTKFSQMLEYDH